MLKVLNSVKNFFSLNLYVKKVAKVPDGIHRSSFNFFYTHKIKDVIIFGNTIHGGFYSVLWYFLLSQTAKIDKMMVDY